MARFAVTVLVVLQPGYLPWLGYFDQLARADLFVHYDDVQFDKNGWRNRNRVKGPEGPVWLSVPVSQPQHGQRIDEVRIDNRRPWARKHVATLTQFYARAPYRDAYLPALADLLQRDWEKLVDLDLAVIALISGWLGITTPTRRASQLALSGDRNDRLVALCRQFSADRYLSGDAAQGYLEPDLFSKAGVDVEWQAFDHPVYAQPFGAFVSHLSAIDMIFNAWAPGRRLARREELSAALFNQQAACG
ncbi:MAG TPA: WbqC family protein [Alphaproteobacteria bacterium]|nr:WbqC family protein [Alphaproteobacteria bacterium]